MGVESSGGPDPGGPRRVSRLVDIAEAVGVHVSTVSRVLNGDPAQSIRPEIYERILNTARQQGYRPNALARALKRRRTGTFAFVVPLLRNPIWARLQRGALQRARERGYVVMIMEEPTEDPRPPGDYCYLVEESRADGLLLATSLRVPEHGSGVSGPPHVYVATAASHSSTGRPRWTPCTAGSARRAGPARRGASAWPSGTPRRPKTAAGTPPRECCAAGRGPRSAAWAASTRCSGSWRRCATRASRCRARCPW